MSTAQIIADLARAKATFQLRAIKAAMGWPYAVRDSGRHPEGENAGTAVEGEACQSGGAAASPKTS